MARDLGIANESLRRWILQTAIDQGEAPGLTSEEHAELVRLRRENAGPTRRPSGRSKNRPTKMA